tara:strand:+ start:158 stop:520 length:363 start_codon:yes stop_codon:yes gene_type:complete
MNDIFFEDLYTYTNKYYKDPAARSARPITKTLADIAKTSPEEYNKQTSNMIPYPGEAIVNTLGTAYAKLSDAHQLIIALYSNPSTNYSDDTKKKVNLKLQNAMKIIKSISKDLDNNDTNS